MPSEICWFWSSANRSETEMKKNRRDQNGITFFNLGRTYLRSTLAESLKARC